MYFRLSEIPTTQELRQSRVNVHPGYVSFLKIGLVKEDYYRHKLSGLSSWFPSLNHHLSNHFSLTGSSYYENGYATPKLSSIPNNWSLSKGNE